MRYLRCGALWILLSVLTCALAQAQDNVVAIEGAKIIDGTGAVPISDGVILIRNGRIAKIGARSSVDIPAGARRVAASGHTIIPALFDSHVHPGLIDGIDISAENYNAARVERDARHQLFFGVTHFLSLGFDRQQIFDFRAAQREGRAVGARAYTAGHGFAPVKGWRTPVPHGAAQDSDWYNRPSDAEQARQLVRKEAARKVDVIKIWVDDLRGQFVKMTPELYGPIIEEAHRNKLKVAAHIVFLEDARELLRHNVDVFAHSVRDRPVDDEFLQIAQARHVVFIPTLIQARFPIDYSEGSPAYLQDPELQKLYDPDFLQKLAAVNHKRFSAMPQGPMRAQFNTAMANIGKIAAAGIPIVAGGDTGVPGRFHGLSVHLEMELLAAGGLSSLQAIQAATLNAARMLGVDRDFGSLQEGKVADLIILGRDPTESITNTRSIVAVWMDGNEVDREGLAKQEVRRGDIDPIRRSLVRFAQERGTCFHPFCHNH